MQTILACPNCKGDLQNQSCPKCGLSFPTVGGIPFLFAHPSLALIQWQGRLAEMNQYLSNQMHSLSLAKGQKITSKTTQEKINLLLHAYAETGKTFNSRLYDLNTSVPHAPDMQSMVSNKISGNQTLESYFPNVFRDWAWQTDENDRALQCVLQLIGNHKLGTLGVFGSGASRLAFDVANASQPEKTIAFDINPFLLTIAKDMVAGQTVELFEFPRTPAKAEWFAVRQTLKAPKKTGTPIDFVLGDVLNPPFKPKAFNTIVSPWLIDILPVDTRWLARLFNSLLQDDGLWINWGPLSYDGHPWHQKYSQAEIADLLLEEGFEVLSSSTTEVPYLQSPYGCQKRVESVFGFAAKKVKNIKYVKSITPFPEWLTDTTQPIPETKALKARAQWHRISADIFGRVDGKNSIASIGQSLGQAYGVSTPQAEASVIAQMLDFCESGN